MRHRAALDKVSSALNAAMEEVLRPLGQTLAGAGLVDRAPTAVRGRVLPVALTKAGRKHLEVASAVVRSVERRMLADVSDTETAKLRQLLDRCTRALGAPDA